jgi:hypothetical protein
LSALVVVALAATNVSADEGPAPTLLSEPARQLLLAQSPSPPAPAAPNAGAPLPSAANAQAPALPAAPGIWPKTLPEAKAEAEAKANPQPQADIWPEGEIQLAKARCTQILKQIDVVAIPEPGVRQGECGSPAPVRLVSIGKKPEVAISPPALVTCDFAQALHNWVKTDLQPLSRKHLGSEIIKIENMSDYSCRTAYGRAKNRLSEHGRANALDIRGFVTAKAEAAMVLEDWGMTERDIVAAKAAAEKAAAEKAAAAAAAAAAAKAAPATANAASTAPALVPASGGRPTIIDGLPRVTVTIPGAASAHDPHLGLVPAKLGGPKAAGPETQKNGTLPLAERKSRFLREAHAAACRIFGTTLGPEANNAHRNHLHIDLAERRATNFCE